MIIKVLRRFLYARPAFCGKIRGKKHLKRYLINNSAIKRFWNFFLLATYQRTFLIIFEFITGKSSSRTLVTSIKRFSTAFITHFGIYLINQQVTLDTFSSAELFIHQYRCIIERVWDHADRHRLRSAAASRQTWQTSCYRYSYDNPNQITLYRILKYTRFPSAALVVAFQSSNSTGNSKL